MYSEELAKQYTGNRDQYTFTDKASFEALKEIGLSGKDVLDLGCGDGRYARILKHAGAHSVVCVDNSPAMITLAEKAGAEQGVSFLLGEAEHLPLQDNSFDVVFSNFVLHYCLDTNAFFRELARVMRPGASAVLTFNIFETENASLIDTEIPLCIGKDVVVQNLIKSHGQVTPALAQAGLALKEYKSLDSSYLSVADGYAFAGDITAIQNILCVSRKATSN